MQEKTYNPFYAHLTDQFCEHSHSNKVSTVFLYFMCQVKDTLTIIFFDSCSKVLTIIGVNRCNFLSAFKFNMPLSLNFKAKDCRLCFYKREFNEQAEFRYKLNIARKLCCGRREWMGFC